MNSPGNTLNADYIPDLREIAMILWRRRLLITAIIATGMVFTAAYSIFRPVTYRAYATLIVEEKPLNLENFKDVTSADISRHDDGSNIETQAKIIDSRNLALKTIESMNLKTLPEFQAEIDGDTPDPNIAMLDVFQPLLYVKTLPAAHIIEVSFEARDPVLAADILNAHIAHYLESQTEAKKQRIQDFSTWFHQQIDVMKTELVAKSRLVQEYRARENLVMSDEADDPVFQQITEISNQLVPIQVRKADLEARLAAIDNASKNSNDITEVVKSTLIQNLKTQASTIAQKVQSLRSDLGGEHPTLKAAQQELEEVNRAIATEIAHIDQSLRTEAKALSEQEALLNDNLYILRGQADQLRSKSIKLQELELEQAASQKLLDNFLAHSEEVQSQINFPRPDATVLASALPPNKSSGLRKIFLLAIGLLVSTLLALTTVLILEILRIGIKNFDDIRDLLHMKPLGIMPQINNPVLASEQKKPGYQENIKRIYMAALMNSPAQTILFTSALPQEGRSTAVMSMAHYLVSLKRRVIVLDMDFFRPSLNRLANIKPTAGVTEFLSNEDSYKNYVRTTISGLSLISAGQNAHYVPDFMHSLKFHDFLKQLKHDYDYVLIDSGPILARTDAIALTGVVDGIIVIAHWLKTSKKDLINFAQIITPVRNKVLGVVLNRVDIKKYKSLTEGSDFVVPKFKVS